MADDVQDAEITLDDFNADEAKPAEPSPAKDKAEAKAEPKVEPQAKDTKEEVTPPDVPIKEEAKPDEQETPAEGEAEPEKPRPAEERKTQLNTEIRDLVSERNKLRDEVTKLNAETYQVATEQELVDGGMTEIEAKVEQMRQEREMDKFNSQVADAQLTISSESDRVLRDFPLFNPDSEDYDKELAEEAAGHLGSMLIIDPNTNQVIGSNGSVYQYYKTLARASGISTTKGQLKGQQDTERQLANVDAGGNAAPPKEKVDPLMELWKQPD